MAWTLNSNKSMHLENTVNNTYLNDFKDISILKLVFFRAHGKKSRTSTGDYDIRDVMEDLMDDFGEMVDEQFPQQQKTRERIKSTNNLDYDGYEGKSDKTVYKSRAARRQTEGNLTFGNNFVIAEPANKSKIERSKSLKATSVSNLLRLLEFRVGFLSVILQQPLQLYLRHP